LTIALRERAIAALAAATPPVQRAVWPARVNDDWRFYFTIEDDAYVIQDIIPHPK
jgi:hypothetical protein